MTRKKLETYERLSGNKKLIWNRPQNRELLAEIRELLAEIRELFDQVESAREATYLLNTMINEDLINIRPSDRDKAIDMLSAIFRALPEQEEPTT